MKKYIIITSVIVLIGIGVFVQKVQKANANRLYFVPATKTSTATTSPYWLGVNAAYGTSTLALDSYLYSPTAIDSATLLVQSTASTSASVQKLYFEYSDDGIDWFNDLIASSTLGTITKNIDNSTINSFTITGNSLASTTRFIISVPTPTRYVRATVNAITASSSIWMQWVPVREVI